VLQAESLEVVLHPADLVINGKKEDVVHARAAIAEQLSFSEAHLPWSKEGNELEDRLNALWRWMREERGKTHWARAIIRLRDIDRELGRLEVPYEGWEVLFRTRLMLERELLRTIVNLSEETRQLTGGYVKYADARLLEGGSTEGEMGIARGNVIGIIAGASVGALAGLLLAPRPGKETRRMLQSQANGLKERASQYATELRNGTGRDDRQSHDREPNRTRGHSRGAA
jgi:hypothetical protein